MKFFMYIYSFVFFSELNIHFEYSFGVGVPLSYKKFPIFLPVVSTKILKLFSLVNQWKMRGISLHFWSEG